MSGCSYQDLIKRGEVLADGRLPPILPMVLYNGVQRWSAVTDVCELIPLVLAWAGGVVQTQAQVSADR